jgi:hypothetical protein
MADSVGESDGWWIGVSTINPTLKSKQTNKQTEQKKNKEIKNKINQK